MKIRTTQKEIKRSYKNIVSVGYCQIQCLFKYESPFAFTAGRDGWNADIYFIDGSTVIVTGYSPFGNIKSKYEINKKYDNIAEKISQDYSMFPEERKEKIRMILQDYISEVIEK